MEENILVGLRSLAKEEEKRIDKATKYLRQVEQAVAQDLFLLFGENSKDRPCGFTIAIDDKLLFNYNLHPRNDNPGIVGFYTMYQIGSDLVDRRIISLQGKVFWFYVGRILGWIQDLPNILESEMGKRRAYFKEIEKIVAALKEEG